MELRPRSPELLQGPYSLFVSADLWDAFAAIERADRLRAHSTFAPLIASGIFYASNGEYHISYVDALFNCVSAVTVCGLATVDLSTLTPWQQVILFLLMCTGSPVRHAQTVT